MHARLAGYAVRVGHLVLVARQEARVPEQRMAAEKGL